MSKTYRGDSLGKEVARSQAYYQADRAKLLYGKKHIVIAGACGDIMFLLRHGVAPHDIIACDADSARLKVARSFGVTIPREEAAKDIAKTVEWAMETYPGQIGTVNVDLCATLPKGASILASILGRLDLRKVHVFFTFIRSFDGMMEESARSRYLQETVGEQVSLDLLPYQSQTPQSGGSPMCVAFLRTNKEYKHAKQASPPHPRSEGRGNPPKERSPSRREALSGSPEGLGNPTRTRKESQKEEVTFGEKVNHFRALRNLSQRELAEMVGSTQAIISLIERDRSGKGPRVMESIERIQNLM